MDDGGQDQDYGGGDSHMNTEEYDDDDDDVDFNLGNGPTTTAPHHDDKPASTPSYSTPAPLPAPTKGPNAKEDG